MAIELQQDAQPEIKPQKNRSGFRHLFDITDFSLPIEAWNATGHVLGTILIASLIINIVSLAFPLTLLQIYDRIIPNQAYSTLILLIIGVTVALIIETLLRITRSYVGAWADSKFEHLMGCRAFETLFNGSLEDYMREGSGRHLKRINSINLMRDFYAGQALVTLADLPFVLILFALLILIVGWLTLVPFIILVVFIVITLVHAKHLEDLLQGRKLHDDRRASFLIETLTNIHTIKSITMEAQMMRRYERLQNTSTVNDYDVSIMGSDAMIQSTMLSQLTVIIMVTIGITMVMNGSLTIGGLAACTLLSGRVLQPISNLVGVWTRLQSIKLARDELQEILDLPPEFKLDAPKLIVTEGEIFFNNVNFRYKKDAPYILKNFNLIVRPKEAICITGKGLQGKSTICWMLLAMLRPESGQVTIDGQNIFDCNFRSLRQQIGYLPQQGMLFNGTIMENLTMFQKGIEWHKKAIAAAKLVGLNDTVEHLPTGYETMVADQSIEALPRGMRQRIAIARAFVHEPPIIIFDEANTAIDMQGDALIKELLEKLVGRVSLIVISHRPSITKIIPKQYLFENGSLRLKK